MILPLIAAVAFQGGLVKTDAKVGAGTAAKPGDYLTMDYTGTLVSGKKFDSSLDRHQPFSFILGAGQVIQGWDQGIAGMKVGGQRKLKIPATLGYGAREMGDIPANSTLLFDVTLRKIERVSVKITKSGSGPAAKGRDSVEVLYAGRLKNGTEFDSSAKHGNQPIPFTIGQQGLVPGFSCGTLGMKLGEKRTVTIPYALAYGEGGQPPVIPAKADLIFDLTLVGLNGKKAK